jgi:hypothetical protein
MNEVWEYNQNNQALFKLIYVRIVRMGIWCYSYILEDDPFYV